MFQIPLADFDFVWVLIPLAPFIIGGVAILVKHQQRMTEILHGSQAQLPIQELASMQEQLNLMRQQLTQVTLALEELKRPTIDESPTRVTERLSQ